MLSTELFTQYLPFNKDPSFVEYLFVLVGEAGNYCMCNQSVEATITSLSPIESPRIMADANSLQYTDE